MKRVLRGNVGDFLPGALFEMYPFQKKNRVIIPNNMPRSRRRSRRRSRSPRTYRAASTPNAILLTGMGPNGKLRGMMEGHYRKTMPEMYTLVTKTSPGSNGFIKIEIGEMSEMVEGDFVFVNGTIFGDAYIGRYVIQDPDHVANIYKIVKDVPKEELASHDNPIGARTDILCQHELVRVTATYSEKKEP